MNTNRCYNYVGIARVGVESGADFNASDPAGRFGYEVVFLEEPTGGGIVDDGV